MDNNTFDHIKVSVIISTYNRFRHLIQAIDSVRNQTHQNIEIIVVNDSSTTNDITTIILMTLYG